MSESILVINAGSSSIKFAVFHNHDANVKRVASGAVSGIGGPHSQLQWHETEDAAGGPHVQTCDASLNHAGAIKVILDTLNGARSLDNHPIAAVGHRVVHGGTKYFAPVIVDNSVMHDLENMVPLAPLHQPHNLAAITALRTAYSTLPQVACFDTAFHRTQPEIAQLYALPRRITESGVRRYGFHGLSYEYIASVLSEYDGRAARGRVIVLHLGNGASMCAIVDGKSVASTMGFTALDGLPMGTRSGALDPGVVLYMLETLHMDVREVQHALYEESGLLGVSGLSSDMRVLQTTDDPAAKRAIDLFVYRIVRELGSLAAAMHGFDAIVFSGGIGEHSVMIRQRVCEEAHWMGVSLDVAANAAGGPRISAADSTVAAWMIPTNEELMIARHTLALV